MFYALRGSNWQLGDSAGTGWRRVTAVPAAPVSAQPGTELAAATPAIHHLAYSDGDGWHFACLKPPFSLVAGYTYWPMGLLWEKWWFLRTNYYWMAQVRRFVLYTKRRGKVQGEEESFWRGHIFCHGLADHFFLCNNGTWAFRAKDRYHIFFHRAQLTHHLPTGQTGLCESCKTQYRSASIVTPLCCRKALLQLESCSALFSSEELYCGV